MKNAVRLLVYFAATILLGALLAPVLFWTAQSLATHGLFSFLGNFDFETFFHRAFLVAAVLLLWPLFRSIRLRNLEDLTLRRNGHWPRDLAAGFFFAALPLLCCGALLIALHIFSLRLAINWFPLTKILGASIAVPLIEEAFFRGLILGILLRSGRANMSIFLTSALFAIVHFLKAPLHTSAIVTWTSGFNSIAHSFSQFSNPTMVAASFTTLFLIGWILADARVVTRSLWLSIGLHAGWIFSSGAFNKIARREILALPWLGKNLLVGIVPLGVACLTWMLMRGWLRYVGTRKV